MQEIVNAVRTQSSPGTFLSGYGTSGLPTSWTAPSYSAAVSSNIFDTSSFNKSYLYETPGSDGKTYAQIPNFDVTEKIKAAYVRLDWGTEVLGMPLDGNVGVRYARTDMTTTGLRTDRSCLSTNLTGCTAVVNSNSVVTLDNSYNDVAAQPERHAAADQREAAGFVVVWPRVMARPRHQPAGPQRQLPDRRRRSRRVVATAPTTARPATPT